MEIKESAYDYVLNNGGRVYIYTNSVRGCCGGQTAVNLEPQVALGFPPPADLEKYQEVEYRKLTIYIHEDIGQETLAGKEIVLKRALGIFKKLILE